MILFFEKSDSSLIFRFKARLVCDLQNKGRFISSVCARDRRRAFPAGRAAGARVMRAEHHQMAPEHSLRAHTAAYLGGPPELKWDCEVAT